MNETPAVPLDTLLAHRAWIRALARSLVRDPADIDDIEQEVYVAAMKGPGVRGAGVERSLRAWLRTVVKNAVYQRHRGESRRSAREKSTAAPAGARDPASIVAEADAHRHVVQAVMDLDEPYRTTVVIRYFEGLSLQETADRLGIPRETVKTRMRRAHGVLRERLRREHGREKRGAPVVLLPLVGGSESLAELLRQVPPAVVGARPWTPLAAAAGLVVAASLFGAAVFAAGSDGDPGVAFVVPPPQQQPGDTGEEAPSEELLENAVALPQDPPRVRPPEEQDTDPQEVELPPPPPTPPDHIVIRDLLTGEAVPGLALKIDRAGTEERFSSDVDGLVSVPPKGIQKVESDDPEWRVPGSPRPVALHEGSLWVHRMATVEVRVAHAGGDAAPGAIRVSSSATTRKSSIADRASGPGTYHFNAITRLDEGDEVDVGPDGTTRLTIPCIRGLRVLARADGWRTAGADVRWLSDRTAAPISLTLQRGISIDGRVRDEDGNAIATAQIHVNTTRLIPAGDIDLGALRDEGKGGLGAIGTPEEGWKISWREIVRPTTRGIFQAHLAVDGEQSLLVEAAGYVAARVPLGRLTEDRHKIEITLKRPDPEKRTRLERAGQPVVNERILFHDVSSWPQVSTYVQTNSDGEFLSDHLVRRKRYSVGCRAPGDKLTDSRFLTWDGRKTIVVEDLSTEFDEDDE